MLFAKDFFEKNNFEKNNKQKNTSRQQNACKISSADNLCKQSGLRLGITTILFQSGSTLFDTVIACIPERNFLRKLILKNISR